MNPPSSVLRQRLLARARFRHLQVLVQVADLGSVRRAADAIGMTQPAVTHLLADLESLINAPLFLRHARGMRPTPLAIELLPVVRRILTSVGDAAEQTAALCARSSGVVRVVAIGGGITSLLVRAVPPFSRKHPEVLIQLQEADPQRMGAVVACGDVDLAICREPGVVPDGWRFVPLLDDRFVVVAGPSHPLARRSKVDLPLLRKETWLTQPSDTASGVAFESLFSDDDGVPAMRQVSARMPAMMWAMLTAEPLLTLVPASVAQQLLDASQLVEIRLEQPLPFDPLGMLVPTEGLGHAAQLMATYLCDFVKT